MPVSVTRSAGRNATEQSGDPPHGRIDVGSLASWLAVPIIAVVLGLTLVTLGSKSLWLDETTSVQIGRLPFLQLRHYLATQEVNLTAYYLVLSAWLRIGVSEAAVRAPSVAFAVSTIPVFYVLARRLAGRAALLAVVLLVANRLVLEQAQDARGYTMLLMLVVTASWLLTLGLEGHQTAWPAWAVVLALAVWTHFFGLLVLTAHLVTILLAGRRRDAVWRSLVSSLALLAAAVVPYVILVRSNGTLSGEQGPGLRTIYSQLDQVAGSGTVILLTLMIGLGVFGIVALWQHDDGVKPRELSLATIVLVPWAVVPIVAALVISADRPIFVARYLIVVVPAVAALVAVGLCRLPRRAGLVGLVAVVILSLLGDVRWWRAAPQEDWRAAFHLVSRQPTRDSGVVFVAGFTRTGFEYYREATATPTSRLPRVVYPPGAWTQSPTLTGAAPAQRLDLIGLRTVWFVQSHSSSASGGLSPQTVEAQLAQGGFRCTTPTRFRGVSVQRCVDAATSVSNRS